MACKAMNKVTAPDGTVTISDTKRIGVLETEIEILRNEVRSLGKIVLKLLSESGE